MPYYCTEAVRLYLSSTEPLQAERQKLLSPFKIAPQQQRGINIDTHGEEGEELSEKDYHRLADLTLGEVMAKLETLIEETSGIADSDLEYSQAGPANDHSRISHASIDLLPSK